MKKRLSQAKCNHYQFNIFKHSNWIIYEKLLNFLISDLSLTRTFQICLEFSKRQCFPTFLFNEAKC